MEPESSVWDDDVQVWVKDNLQQTFISLQIALQENTHELSPPTRVRFSPKLFPPETWANISTGSGSMTETVLNSPSRVRVQVRVQVWVWWESLDPSYSSPAVNSGWIQVSAAAAHLRSQLSINKLSTCGLSSAAPSAHQLKPSAAFRGCSEN